MMKKLLAPCASLLLAAPAPAQWLTATYALKGGCNAIFLHGDASYAPPATLFASYPEILEVWRGNPHPTQVQFTASPQIPSAGTPEWSVWKRDGTATTLSQMIGQSAYLVKCSGTTANTSARALVQRARPPAATWQRSGANLLGFPSAYANATFSAYFATFPAAIAANARIYKYPGGDLGPGNPLQLFAPTAKKIDHNKAYWFDSAVVGHFSAPIELSLSQPSGLDFGRTGSAVTLKILNRSAVTTTITLAPVASAAAPTEASFASLLRLTDSANICDILLPATAQKAALAGLWVGEAQVSAVESKAPGFTATGCGSSAIAGTYAETSTSLHKEALYLDGTFELRRASDVGTPT